VTLEISGADAVETRLTCFQLTSVYRGNVDYMKQLYKVKDGHVKVQTF